MEKYILNSVDEMFRWKLTTKELENEKHIAFPSVEEANSEKTYPNKGKINLNWEITDVLYSFTLIYYLGLTVVNNERFEKLFEQEKELQGNKRLRRNSTRFLYKCSKDKAFSRLNESPELVSFIKLYFSIGNVIPIWPGGNEARGKKGMYDIPELFFTKYKTWTLELIRQYPNAYMNAIINNDMFLVFQTKENEGCTIKECQKSSIDLNDFKEYVKNKTNIVNYTGFYFDYLIRRTAIIKQREVELMKWL